ncbi:MAG TPA: hypothetical protein V6C57_29210 [Coleofasciculaceae cyanobacterium]
MWRAIIQCSAEAWRNHASAFKAIAAKYPATPLSSKKMKGDERRIMEYQLDTVSDTEDFLEECLTLEGFSATFESL